MPRTIDPSTISSGGGFVHPDSVGSPATPDAAALNAHLTAVAAAHPAVAVTVADSYNRYRILGPNVESALDELAALVPTSMGPVGSAGPAWLGSSTTGVPDWGILKLVDGAITPTGNTAANTRGVYPYYYRAPITPTGSGITGTGVEVATDPTFNYYDGAGYPAYTGGGVGLAHVGFTTISMGGSPVAAYPTWRLLPAINSPATVVSGVVCPADRGVLALVKWGTGDLSAPVAATTTAEVLDRCAAALLLGRGMESGDADGRPGGIFVEASGPLRAFCTIDFTGNPAAGYTVELDLSPIGGPVSTFTAVVSGSAPFEFVRAGSAAATRTNFAKAVNTLLFPEWLVVETAGGGVNITLAVPGTIGNTCTATAAALTVYDFNLGQDAVLSPFTFPGRAAGQFNLDEIHQGSVLGAASAFRNPAAGQVRLLTDPSAFPAAGTPTAAGGIPILGATSAAVGTATAGVFPFDTGGGTDGNFFAYRLPHLRDYGVTSGLHYTPAAEKARFTTKLPPATPGALTTAGDYSNFDDNFWAYQVARYRHRHVLATGASGTLRQDNSLAIVHFKREADFEAYVRDGIAPAADAVYSINLVTWSGGGAILNFTEEGPPVATADSFPVVLGEIAEDPAGDLEPTLGVGAAYTLARGVHEMRCSGVGYHVPWDPTQLATPEVGINDINITLNGLFDSSYRTHDKVPSTGPFAADDRSLALNQNPVFLSLASYSFEGTEASTPTSTITKGSIALFPGGMGEVRRQRIEFGFADLTGGVDDPGGGDSASIIATSTLANGVTFAGDTSNPVFTTDARLRVFVRRPLAVDGGTGYPLPYVGGNTASFRGFNIGESTGDTILYHSMKETLNGAETVAYGNPQSAFKAGFSTTKDKTERFLDEVYRYPGSWTPLGGAPSLNLIGPGLPSGISAINVPVRPGTAPYTGFYFLGAHTSPLGLGEAQVAGMPARNPPASEGLTSPVPSRGRVMYPTINYSVGYSPAGPDYSATAVPVAYVRVFDAGIANVGSTTLVLKIWGVTLSEFLWTAGDPGSANMAILVKLPGLSTWMDAGRTDGTGPSKQDPALDGAGCKVVGSGTFSSIDAETQIVYAQVTVNLGAALFANAEVTARCPVAVAVVLYNTAGAKALNFTQGGEDGSTISCRGVVGIDVNPT